MIDIKTVLFFLEELKKEGFCEREQFKRILYESRNREAELGNMIEIDFMLQGEYLSSYVFNDIIFANRGTSWFYETTGSPIYYVFTRRSKEILERGW